MAFWFPCQLELDESLDHVDDANQLTRKYKEMVSTCAVKFGGLPMKKNHTLKGQYEVSIASQPVELVVGH